MKTLLFTLFLTLFATNAWAEMRCVKDFTGATVCTVTQSPGSNLGGWNPPQVIRGTRDFTGATVWTDQKGNSTRCSKDFTGAVICK